MAVREVTLALRMVSPWLCVPPLFPAPDRCRAWLCFHDSSGVGLEPWQVLGGQAARPTKDPHEDKGPEDETLASPRRSLGLPPLQLPCLVCLASVSAPLWTIDLRALWVLFAGLSSRGGGWFRLLAVLRQQRGLVLTGARTTSADSWRRQGIRGVCPVRTLARPGARG